MGAGGLAEKQHAGVAYEDVREAWIPSTAKDRAEISSKKRGRPETRMCVDNAEDSRRESRRRVGRLAIRLPV